MSEKEIEIKMPIYTTEELNAIDNAVMNDFDNLVSTAIKHIYRDRECIILQKIVKKQQQEIEKYKRYFKLAISDLQSEGYMQMPYKNIEKYYSKRKDVV